MTPKALDPGWINAFDLVKGGKFITATVEISAVHKAGTVKFSNGQVNERVAMEFKGKSKKFMPCKTQAELLIPMLQCNSPTGWVGKSITLYVARVNLFGGGKGPGIRIKPEGISNINITPRVKAQMGDDLTGKTLAE